MVNPIDKLGNEIHVGEMCVLQDGDSIGVYLYSHKAAATYVFKDVVRGEIIDSKIGLSYGRRFIQHTQVSTKVIRVEGLSKLKKYKLD